MRDASDLVLAHGDGRIISTAKNRSRYRGRIWRGRSRVDKELRKLMSQELDEIFDKAHLDREKAEVVSRTESTLLVEPFSTVRVGGITFENEKNLQPFRSCRSSYPTRLISR